MELGVKSIAGQLRSLLGSALIEILGADGEGVDPLIRAAGDEKFGDYQSNVAMSLAKRLEQKPREVAQQIVDALATDAQATELCEPFEIAGPGFINIRLKTEWLAAALNAIPAAADQDKLGIEPADEPQTVVVDYSGPNIAKQMHVGHLRSTIIGDTIARVLEFEGHKVIRQNHIGDWGVPIAMVITQLEPKYKRIRGESSPVADDQFTLEEVEREYKTAVTRFAEDPGFERKVRANLLDLQARPSPDESWVVDLYFLLCRVTLDACNELYNRLRVKLVMRGWVKDTHDELIVENPGGVPVLFGESEYEKRLPAVVNDLEAQFGSDDPGEPGGPPPGPSALGETPRITVSISDGALCVFHYNPDGTPMFVTPDDRRLPMIIRKSDGAFLYATTDLAAMKFRISELNADRVIYVTDARQMQHFEMVFATAWGAGWTQPEDGCREVQLEHVTFGSILGPDRKPLKTRSGENVKLADLLDEAVGRAEALIRSSEADPAKKRGFTDDEIKDVAEAVGIGAVKYADLSQNRQSDYLFSWDKMLAMEGNTAPYMMYAYARIRSIYRKGAEEGGGVAGGSIVLTEAAERTLARQILRFAEMLESVAGGLRLNLLTDYLYVLAGGFMRFYEACPVLKADTAEQRASRLKLCDLAARTLEIGLGLLGIRVVERM